MKNVAINAVIAKNKLMSLSTEKKNFILLSMAAKLEKNTEKIYEANREDLREAKKLVDKGEISNATFQRLKLDENKMRDMIQGIKDVAALEDPIGASLLTRELDEGLILEKVVCPIGVIGVIFEARPDVITQISALALKTGNAVILKGGRESNNTNTAIYNLIASVMPENAVSLLVSRDDVSELLKQDTCVDLIIPRGSNELVKFVKENTKIPVLGHASGICNIYVDKSADKEKAIKICVDSKCQYPSACNSVENILVHQEFPHVLALRNALLQAGVKFSEDEDYAKEFGDKIVNFVEVPEGFDVSIIIEHCGSHHTDCIIAENMDVVNNFIKKIDSAGVYHNCSTRFADGFRYGFGAEVGISTNKTHARGPVGLDGLTIYKYILRGNGHIVADYAEGRKKFTHKDII